MTPGLATPKPARGSRRMELLDKRAAFRTHEKHEKDAVRIRDKWQCRFPECDWLKKGFALNVAHLEHKGAGGDRKRERTQRQKLIALCFQHHKGSVSLDSGDIRIEPETDRGTDDLCAFYVSDVEERWKFVGVN